MLEAVADTGCEDSPCFEEFTESSVRQEGTNRQESGGKSKTLLMSMLDRGLSTLQT